MAERSNIPAGEWLWLRIFNEKGIEPRVIREQWTLYDVLNAHEALDLKLHTQQLVYDLSRRK